MDAKAGSIKVLQAIHKPAQEWLIISLLFQVVLTQIASMQMHSQSNNIKVKVQCKPYPVLGVPSPAKFRAGLAGNSMCR